MDATKAGVYSLIESMSDVDFSLLKGFLNSSFEKTAKRKAAEKRFVSEVTAAEKSVEEGNYVTLAKLHKNLGVSSKRN